ncbi:hypothetical protein C475_16943 [Halosimplex carlsbadense 2-9-1]|uniref:Uncharacterized protein n=1 Tax=Halosimplex carlsbadense 2-9-1 TaxID=797114 RepID=M0CK04_9EURY|nr:hypothetical protein [Halosimplex carlsbadense]ELZ22219.1 hypothetical protein C475_16943 [Halosimplex carlsbadense 2-9-1]
MADPFTRRECVAVVATVLSAGCLPGDSSGARRDGSSPETGQSPRTTAATASDTESGSVTETAVPTPSPSACPAEPRVPEPSADHGDLPSIPDPPDTLGETSARTYVETYEYAYKYREMAGYGEGLVEFNLDLSTEASRVGPNAVLVTSGYAMDHGRWTDGEGTPYGYFDGYRYSFAYLVTHEAVWRATRRETENPPDPRADGAVLECL